MCVKNEVCIVNGRQQTPESVYLRVILIDLGSKQENGGQKQGYRECRDQWVCGYIKYLEGLGVGDRLGDLLEEIVELWDVRHDCFLKIGAVCQ